MCVRVCVGGRDDVKCTKEYINNYRGCVVCVWCVWGGAEIHVPTLATS